MKSYKEIKPNFTVDRFVDGQAPTANDNSFQSMVNFIPKSGSIESRFGISELPHTPDTTGTLWNPEDYDPGDNVYIPGDPTDYAVIQAIINFNSFATFGQNMLNGVLIFSPAGSVQESGYNTIYELDKVEGVGSMIMTDDTAVNTSAGEPNRCWGMVSKNKDNKPQWLPGADALPQAFFMTYWFKPFNANPSANAEWHFNIGNDCNGGLPTLTLRHFDNDFQCQFTDSAGSSLYDYNYPNVVQGEWQFISIWNDRPTGFSGLYYYGATNGEYYATNNGTPRPSYHFYTSSARDTIGGSVTWDGGILGWKTNADQAYHGLMDYITMWSKPMHINNSSNITISRLLKNLAWIT